MFVLSVKTSKKQLLSLLACIILLAVILAVVIIWPPGDTAATAAVTYSAKDEAERIAFLQSLGYQTDVKYTEVREILIPEEFDEVFAQYNEIQRQANMDLEPYRGKRVKCWTYKLYNHPEEGEVYAHLYVYKDKIIGGDISSTALNGFMTGLIPLKDIT